MARAVPSSHGGLPWALQTHPVDLQRLVQMPLFPNALTGLCQRRSSDPPLNLYEVCLAQGMNTLRAWLFV